MAGVDYITLEDLEGRFGSRQVLRVFADDGRPSAGPRLGRSITGASRQADAILLGAFSLDQIATLVTEDQAVLDAVCDIAMAEGMKARFEWAGDSTPYTTLASEAKKVLKEVASARLRSAGETVAGANPNARAGLVSTERSPHTFIVAPSRSRPVRGGF